MMTKMEPNKSYFVARIEDLKMLRIHDPFVKNIPINVFMMKIIEGGGGGSCWDVVVKRTRDNGMFLEDGWKEFLRLHSLSFGDILVFHYDGSTKLEVMRLITSSTMGQMESVMAAYYFQELKKQESTKRSASSNLESSSRNARVTEFIRRKHKKFCNGTINYSPTAERFRDYAENWETDNVKHVAKNSKRFRSDCGRAYSQHSSVPATHNAKKTPDPADRWGGQTNGVDTSEKTESERSAENDLAKHVAKNYEVYADHPREYARNAESFPDYAEKWETGCIKHAAKNSKRFRSDCRRAYSQRSSVPATRNAEKTPDPANSWDGETNGVEALEKIESESSAEHDLAKYMAKNYKMYADHPRAYAGCNLGPVMQNVERAPDTAENFDQYAEVNPSGQIVSDNSEKNVVFQDNKQVQGVDTSSKKMSKNLIDDVVFQDDYRNYDVDTSERGVVFEENWQNDLYRRICLRYGRLEGSQVLEKTNDMLILTLKEILNVAKALESVNVDTLLPGTLQSWENTTEVGELFKFNVSWLRNLVNEVKALFSSRQSLAEDVDIRNACESLSKLKEKAELAKKELEALVQAENNAKKALGEAHTRLHLKSATIFRLNI